MIKQLLKYMIFGVLYLSGVSALYRRLTTSRLRILCYHRISPHAGDTLLDVSAARFHAQMQYLKRHYIPVTLTHGLDLLRRPGTRNVMPPVAVTFDDGTSDWLTHALPVLSKVQIPALFFVCTGYIDHGPIPYPNRHTPAIALSRQQLSLLAASPFTEIGGHTLSHPHLSRLNAEGAFKEITESRTLLSTWLNKNISMFAYPFGDEHDYTEKTMSLTRDAGYGASCTLDERTCGPRDDPFSLPRLVIFDEPLWMFKVRVSGILDDFLSLWRKQKSIASVSLTKDIKNVSIVQPSPSPTLSVVIRTRNHESMLRKALEGVAMQTFKDWEAIILDDDSADHTPDVAAEFCRNDSRFLYIRHSPPLGQTPNCNHGLYLARGEFIAILDGDDYWCDPEKLARQVALMRNNPHIAVSAGGVVKIDVIAHERTHVVPNVWHTDHDIRNAIMIENMLPHSAVVFRRKDALMVGGYEEHFHLSEDFDLFLKLGLRGAFHMDERTYCHYHLHRNNATDLQKALQLIATLRILVRHAAHYPHAVRGILHVILRLLVSLLPLGFKNRVAAMLRYRDRRYRFMARLAEKDTTRGTVALRSPINHV